MSPERMPRFSRPCAFSIAWMSFAVTSMPAAIAVPPADQRLRVEQHRAGDERRDLLDAELEQRRVGRRLHFALRQAAVVGDLSSVNRTLAVPGSAAYREVAERVDLRALLAGLGVLVEGLGVERVGGAGDRRGRLRPHLVGAGERRERHVRRAQLRQLVGLRLRLRRGSARSSPSSSDRAAPPCQARRRRREPVAWTEAESN